MPSDEGRGRQQHRPCDFDVVVRPRHARQCRVLHQPAATTPFCHCCGGVRSAPLCPLTLKELACCLACCLAGRQAPAFGVGRPSAPGHRTDKWHPLRCRAGMLCSQVCLPAPALLARVCAASSPARQHDARARRKRCRAPSPAHGQPHRPWLRRTPTHPVGNRRARPALCRRPRPRCSRDRRWRRTVRGTWRPRPARSE